MCRSILRRWVCSALSKWRSVGSSLPPCFCWLSASTFFPADRVLGGRVSGPPIYVGGSITARVTDGSICAKIFVFDISEWYHAHNRPHALCRQWVDDLVIMCAGSNSRIRRQFPRAIVSLVKALRKRGLEVASKSTISTNQSNLPTHLSLELRKAGLQVAPAFTGPDFGLDQALTGASRRPKAQARAAAARDREMRASGLPFFLNKQALALHLLGTLFVQILRRARGGVSASEMVLLLCQVASTVTRLRPHMCLTCWSYATHDHAEDT